MAHHKARQQNTGSANRRNFRTKQTILRTGEQSETVNLTEINTENRLKLENKG